jgi:hypothetical protein
VSSVPVKEAQDLNREALSHSISRSMSAFVAQQHVQLRKLEEAEPWCGYTKRNCRSFAENAMVTGRFQTLIPQMPEIMVNKIMGLINSLTTSIK